MIMLVIRTDGRMVGAVLRVGSFTAHTYELYMPNGQYWGTGDRKSWKTYMGKTVSYMYPER